MSKLELKQMSFEMVEILFKALDIKNPRCAYCDSKIIKNNWGGLFPTDNPKKPIIICKSVLCMTQYLEEEEDDNFEEKFNKFIKKWCGNSYNHLIDTDENDGQELRDFVKNNFLYKQKVKEAFDIIKSIVNIIPNDLSCNFDFEGKEKMDIKTSLIKTIELKEKELKL